MSTWAVSAEKLDREQEYFILNEIKKEGNKWIKGYPGSGKSVAMMHTLNQIKIRKPEATVLITYFTHSLKQLYIAGMYELGIKQKNIVFMTYLQFEKQAKHYDYILCDEVQDLTAHALLTMRNNCNQLILAGDPNQSIFDNTVNVREIPTLTNCSEYSLNTIHRLTKSVIKVISLLLPDMGILGAKQNEMKEDTTSRLANFHSLDDEVEYVTTKSFQAISSGVNLSAAVLLPTHNDVINFVNTYCKIKNTQPWQRINNRHGKPNYELMNQHTHDLKLHYLGNDYGNLHDAHKSGKLILMTYHSAKGLDFDEIFLPFLNDDAKIINKTNFMIALSRSKNTLTLSYCGNMHEYLTVVENQLHKVSTDKIAEESDQEFDFDF